MATTWLNILLDFFAPVPRQKTLIVTDVGIPIWLFNQREFQVCTPFLTTSDTFGHNRQFGIGHLVHGDNNIRVNRPRLGQVLYFWTLNWYGIVSPRQTIRQIYFDRLDISPAYLANILHQIEVAEQKIQASSLHILTECGNERHSFNRLLGLILSSVILLRRDEWTIPKPQSKIIAEQASSREYSSIGLDGLYRAGFIKDNDRGEITVLEPLIVMFMNAIHKAKPMSTRFNQAGILEFYPSGHLKETK
ncbi:TPA: hypothetical protein DIU27_04795 [Candidatus Collierbacteria bacterium]|uniref:Uncharacterized protein n=1 Tax=Candidatus Collierbacteria bacterium GW2011_GWB2_44_22 TaxID=1618387 RepID=A0A0G1HXD2_9BACT|nr:MAG: hypothetical protein UW31_C0016G0003 [Candidatus Collierbacteria bacterium GW2011_GWA2_44_13]KKT51781.1 MAG: hypothetical protein UW44_C0008G0103 [Candidatus Collierbacteria bacterium GW2011_GWB2_44_22]KKT65463.1 MAG: hypothetical protein UW58_C0029G0003 [Candidatus Collierbacteria bacterium GW2011_GWC2_44_30]KKT68317.1 MAG: hypothetical protein UW64_C0023G0033 [Microgenomates group bacterium GW2011_GWC1_44_37]KKT88005.1 MAG: hypothetical protein UW88_C0017G0026 [Candidatus Collierbacte